MITVTCDFCKCVISSEKMYKVTGVYNPDHAFGCDPYSEKPDWYYEKDICENCLKKLEKVNSKPSRIPRKTSWNALWVVCGIE